MSKSLIFLVKSYLGNFYRHLAIFSGHTDRDWAEEVTQLLMSDVVCLPSNIRNIDWKRAHLKLSWMMLAKSKKLGGHILGFVSERM